MFESGKLMKDEDLHKRLRLNDTISDQIYKQLSRDSKFLMDQQIMDYSLLLGIYYVGINPARIQLSSSSSSSSHQLNHLENKDYQPPINNNNEQEDKKENEEEHEEEKENEIIDKNIHNQSRPRAKTYFTSKKEVGNNDKAIHAEMIEGPGIYYIGIIDMLQKWNYNKKLERYVKVYVRFKDPNGISCVEPIYYRKRFLRRIKSMGIQPK